MKQGRKSMSGPYILFALAVLIMAVAVFMSWKSGPDDDLLASVNESKGQSKKSLDTCQDLKKSIDDMNARMTDFQMKVVSFNDSILKSSEVTQSVVSNLKQDQDILSTRMHSLEKKIIGVNRTVTMKLSNDGKPLEVEVVQSKKDSLLKRAGVK